MNLFDLYSELKTDDFCFAYLDHFSDSSTDALIALQDARLADKRKVRKKISFLVTECFQNVVRHTEHSDQKLDKLFGMRSCGPIHSISTINPIIKSQREQLQNSIDHLNELSPEELKAVYLGSLTGNDFNNKGGAGLGLIEMARKTNRVPLYSFDSINDELDSFTLNLSLSENKEEPTKESNRSMATFYPYFKAENVLMMQKGNFSQEIVVSLFELVENNLQQNLATARHTKSLYLMVELLQNMSANTIEIDGKRNGIFQIKLGPHGGFIFQTGNCVTNAHALELKKYIESLENLNKIDLLKKYNMELKKGLSNDDSEHRGGIGLLEILKLTDGNLDFEMTQINDETSFVSFSAMVKN
ncbi:MAG: hypothetical protein GQ574_11185 [Crocinitomix sp.]|nr:hypothetical protein [Crocinitomix sp.]